MVVINFTPARTVAAVNRYAFDAAYIERLGRGDPQTEAHFYAYFGALILIKARARRLSGALAEDVRQETFLRVLRTLQAPGGLRSAPSLGAFVNSVCHNVLRERCRDQKRHEPRSVELAALPDRVAPNAEQQLISDERTRAVRRVIDDLPPRDRDLLRALFMEEREKEEVCRQLGVSRDYLRVLLHRAKNQFRAQYLERENPPAFLTDRAGSRQPAQGSAGR